MSRLTSFADLEAALRERTNFELRTPPASGFHLERMQGLVEALGHPERSCPMVHVAGTCGKGTTSAALASCLDAAGLSVGWTTSPHLIHLRERIRIGARPASDELWLSSARAVFAAADACPEPPTYFELVIAMAFEAFRQAEVQVAVVEVGLGGRLDATNVLTPAVSVITRIGLDHTALLGDTLAAIAREKAGIIKPGAPVIAGPESPEASAVVEARAAEVGAPLLLLDRDLTVEVLDDEGERCSLALQTPWRRFSLQTPLSGPVARNAGLIAGALGTLFHSDAIDALPSSASSERSEFLASCLRMGLARLRWRGRFDVVHGEGLNVPPAVVVDGAHDANSAAALASRYRLRFGAQRCVLLFGIMRDKPLAAVLESLAPLCSEAICCRLDSPRSADPKELVEAFTQRGVPVETPPDPLSTAMQRAQRSELPLLVTGSLYLAGQTLAQLGVSADPGWAE